MLEKLEDLSQENKMNQQFLEIIKLAESNTDEGWEQIDSQLDTICDDSNVINWARENTLNSSDGLRDLAGTIFEASSVKLTDNDIKLLQELMGDEGYPGFRAACALAKRLDSPEIAQIKDSIEGKLKDFIEDDDVSEIANEYLKFFNV